MVVYNLKISFSNVDVSCLPGIGKTSLLRDALGVRSVWKAKAAKSTYFITQITGVVSVPWKE